ncbi:MAG TPA: hypothetical protein VMS73_09950, partial [Anaerolineaceae bacterium]|nr:hypothetical protein [Anaerolineaceae bacterium]
VGCKAAHNNPQKPLIPDNPFNRTTTTYSFQSPKLEKIDVFYLSSTKFLFNHAHITRSNRPCGVIRSRTNVFLLFCAAGCRNQPAAQK